MIIIVCGLPGSGKSYFAQRLSQMLHAAYISSDAVRKELFRNPSYSDEEKRKVYDEMMKRISDAEYYKEVAVDATFSDVETRRNFIREAKKIAPVFIVEIVADEDLIKQRLAVPRQDSNADFAVYKKMKSTWPLFTEPHLVLHSTNDNIADMLDETTDYLFSKTMNQENIKRLIDKKNFPSETTSVDLTETHISWVIICDEFVYKIKKPVKYSFLDFSTLGKRKLYCEREVELNKRLTNDVYLGIIPVKKNTSEFFIDGNAGEIIDYAVHMRKLPEERRMDKLLSENKVTVADVKNLAIKISNFHKQTNTVYKENISNMKDLFNDILTQRQFLEKQISCGSLISDTIKLSDKFFEMNAALMKKRCVDGFVRDCHGDLHSRNIFLLPEPVPFDCLEFNDDLRQIDVLDEIAFLCMDLDAYKRRDLSDLFFQEYKKLFPIATTDKEQDLFIYYKAYRANIRAKVNSLRAKDGTDENKKKKALDNAGKYLLLMNDYITSIAA
ncbi:MAG TPA: AAA family ATPase [Parafilimonas sp.]|nr:AAA family ATPase [Parafilimonas sp.]